VSVLRISYNDVIVRDISVQNSSFGEQLVMARKGIFESLEQLKRRLESLQSSTCWLDNEDTKPTISKF